MYKSLVSVLVGETDRARGRKKFSKKKKKNPHRLEQVRAAEQQSDAVVASLRNSHLSTLVDVNSVGREKTAKD